MSAELGCGVFGANYNVHGGEPLPPSCEMDGYDPSGHQTTINQTIPLNNKDGIGQNMADDRVDTISMGDTSECPENGGTIIVPGKQM